MSSHRSYMITNSKVLTAAEQEALTRVCGRILRFEILDDIRNALMFSLLLECGLRASELLAIRIKDFNPEACSLYIQSLKGSNARELPIRAGRGQQLKKWILRHFKKEFWHNLDPDARIFQISYCRLFQIWQFYTPAKEKTLHSLRHTFAVNLYERSKDIMAVKLALGHRCIDNTLVYVDFWYSQNQLRRLMHG